MVTIHERVFLRLPVEALELVGNAAEFWPERVRMMRRWANELDRLREFGRIVKLSA
jgi:hypothetical protein